MCLENNSRSYKNCVQQDVHYNIVYNSKKLLRTQTTHDKLAKSWWISLKEYSAATTNDHYEEHDITLHKELST